MQEMTPEQHQQIIDQLERLNEKLAKQNSWLHIFLTALVYGVGFVIGSTMLASVIIGFALPFLRTLNPFHNIGNHSIQMSTSTQQ